MLTVNGLAEIAPCAPKTVYRAIRNEKLHATKGKGGEFAIDEASAEEWLRARGAIHDRANESRTKYSNVAALYKSERVRAVTELAAFALDFLDRYEAISNGRVDAADASATYAEIESCLKHISDRFATARILRDQLNAAFADFSEADGESKAARALEIDEAEDVPDIL